MNRGRNGFTAVVLACVFAAPVLAQAPAEQDSAERPTEYGIRFTPGIARAMARTYVQEAMVPRYNLDPSKIDQATEAVARRFMEIAHRFDDGGYAGKFEQMVEGIMAGQLNSEGSTAIQPRSGKAIAEALKPAMPAIRDLVRGLAQDIRPMLAPKEQLKFGRDLLGFSAAMNAFDEALDRWALGDVRPGENPFESGGRPKLDDSGHSPAYNAAQRQAQQEVQKGEWEEWKQYVEDAKKLYAFDEGQVAGANSILNECLDHVAQYTRRDEWQRKVERNRLWMNLLGPLQVAASHPLRYCLQRSHGQLLDPIRSIGEELRQRIDAIPTAAQRRAADERVLQMLGEQGFVEASAGQPGPPASREASPREPARSVPPAPTEVFDEKGSANDESGDFRRGP